MAAMSSQQKHFLASKKIIVAGAGLSGLSFVIALRKQWTIRELAAGLGSTLDPITITIYERDTEDSATQRAGYSMSIRSDGFSGGVQAMAKLGLLEPMLRAGLVLGGGFTFWDAEWKTLIQMKQPSDKQSLPSLRIERSILRQVLLAAVPSGDVVHWGTSCIAAEQLPNGRVRVSLSDGGTDECDLLISADGANSKIRASLRPDDKLSFKGVVMICGQTKCPDGVPKPMDRSFGSLLGGGGTGLFVAPMGEDIALWAVSYHAKEPVATLRPPLAEEQARELIDEALRRGKGFNEPFQTLVQGTDLSTVWLLNAKDKKPFPHVDGNKKCGQVIFIGDSNHAMSPFSGNGANMALMDGCELADQLCNSSSLLAALTAYDASSIPRSTAAVKRSHLSISMMHATGWKLTFYIILLKIVKFLFFRR